MKGLIIWAQSTCRSTMGLYGELVKQLNVPVVIALWHYETTKCDLRTAVGLDPNEFCYLDFIDIGEDWNKGTALIDAHPGFAHLFAVYQGSHVWRELACEAKRRGEIVFVGSESPCNMSNGFRRLLKEIYLYFVLPCKVRNVVRVADRFINYSGDDNKYARVIGWPKDKIVPFGYFPPPLTGSKVRLRSCNSPFTILSTGILSRHRGADVLLDALCILKERGVDYHAIITQDGELLERLRLKAKKYSLPVEFPGFLSMERLIGLYESCSIYVGAGRHEPWGMRLNDALNCGAPLVVSDGMGGVKMVHDFGCGLAFKNGDAKDLADKIELLASNNDLYLRIARNVCTAVENCSPSTRARGLISILNGVI